MIYQLYQTGMEKLIKFNEVIKSNTYCSYLTARPFPIVLQADPSYSRSLYLLFKTYIGNKIIFDEKIFNYSRAIFWI